MPSTVEVMAEAFQEAGTPFIVGHPGGESVELMQAVRERGMRFILVKQESAGAMLAATWGDITGAPGVCMSTRAPGAANMVNGVTHAWMDRSPLIAITDQYGPADLRDGPAPAARSACPLRLGHQVERHHRRAHGPPHAAPGHAGGHRAAAGPGPARPAVERDAAGGSGPAGRRAAAADLAMLRPDRDSLRRPWRCSARPAGRSSWSGWACCWDRASAGVVALAEQLGAPVMTTTKAKGVIPEDHPLRAGALIGGLIEREIVSQADLIVAIGLDAVELQPKPWPYSAPVLALSSVQSTDALVPADPELVGNLEALLDQPGRVCAVGLGLGRSSRPRVPSAAQRRPGSAVARAWRRPGWSRSRATCCRATPSPRATRARAACWWSRSGRRTARASS